MVLVRPVDRLNKDKTYYHIKGCKKKICVENVNKFNLSLQGC